MVHHYDSAITGKAPKKVQGDRRIFDTSKGKKVVMVEPTTSVMEYRVSRKTEQPPKTKTSKEYGDFCDFPWSCLSRKDLELQADDDHTITGDVLDSGESVHKLPAVKYDGQPQSAIILHPEEPTVNTQQIQSATGFEESMPPLKQPASLVPQANGRENIHKLPALKDDAHTQSAITSHLEEPVVNTRQTQLDSLFFEESMVAIKQTTSLVPRAYGPEYGRVDGCFGGESVVYMDGGGIKPVAELRKGDIIKCDFEGHIAEVRCVLVMHAAEGEKLMVKFENGLVITPMHPIIFGGAWALPGDLRSPSKVELRQVYNFVLEKQHTILINNVVCCTLGHRREGHTAHPFWGDLDSIVGCMQRVDRVGFEKGLVEILGTIRENGSGPVYGLRSLSGNIVT